MPRRALYAQIPAYAEIAKAASRERAFERDKVALRSLGVPIESVELNDGLGGRGYVLAPLKTGFLRLDRRKRTLLIAAADSLAALPGAPLRALAQTALAKLIGAPTGAPKGAHNDPRLGQLIQWLSSPCSLQFRYRGVGDHSSERSVTLDDPLLECREQRWYVSGFDCEREADRSFRLERVRGKMTRLQAGVGRRARAPWSRWRLGAGPVLNARLRRLSDAAPLPAGLLPRALSGDEVEVTTSNRDALLRLLCEGKGWVCLEPLGLRHEVIERLERLASTQA